MRLNTFQIESDTTDYLLWYIPRTHPKVNREVVQNAVQDKNSEAELLMTITDMVAPFHPQTNPSPTYDDMKNLVHQLSRMLVKKPRRIVD